ncbi:MAG: hypothetical protein A2365_03775 [Candidatus Nealsonbacteria bacterium RIFOXYB1_FULL_40_15]|uniref:Uncharacterized protein n=2 Tax=Candidatus Nealsoniibacteriota TaxID=1817911 RepID=A0A1G2ENC0_9BACT|nr:MAG: hypothetical protein A2427_00915 [Candidatus Nealsonbacteria bacterium RIFOXYC1_FULL_40_7]OGZ27733.1 MAG: hypothetical protein A2365_03775 [Candidatus Nealsonbacteria bacterium RIFOXYB1_FULL_40_15]OGZ29544.1 MAG: hypothetical protein A2562_02545 [Candidatus Nealsonbacteria bacterium RIFOXYD1_FULL_39_11]
MENNIFPSQPAQLPPPKKKFPLWAKSAVLAVIIIVLAGGIALASRIWDPLWNPFRPSPEEIMSRMNQEMDNVLTSSVKIEANASQKDQSFSVLVEGDIDGSDPELAEFDGKFDFSGSFKGISISLSGNYLVSKEGVFLKINNIPPLPIPVDLSVIEGKWIKAGESSGQAGLEDIFSEKDIFYVKKELKDEKIDGVSAYHLITGIRAEKIRDVFESSYMIPVDYSKLTEAANKFDMDLFIGKKDYLLRGVRISQTAEEGTLMSINIDFTDFGKEFDIKGPDEFLGQEEIQQILLPLMGLGAN